MLVGDIMRGDVKTAEAGDTFADVAKQMRANGISSVVVLGKDGALALYFDETKHYEMLLFKFAGQP